MFAKATTWLQSSWCGTFYFRTLHKQPGYNVIVLWSLDLFYLIHSLIHHLISIYYDITIGWALEAVNKPRGGWVIHGLLMQTHSFLHPWQNTLLTNEHCILLNTCFLWLLQSRLQTDVNTVQRGGFWAIFHFSGQKWQTWNQLFFLPWALGDRYKSSSHLVSTN